MSVHRYKNRRTLIKHLLPPFHRPGNIYYPGFKRNFWLEFTSPRSEAAPSPAPAPAPVAPRPHFLHPSTNGSVMTVTLGQTTRVDCEVADLAGYQVVNIVTDPSVRFSLTEAPYSIWVLFSLF